MKIPAVHVFKASDQCYCAGVQFTDLYSKSIDCVSDLYLKCRILSGYLTKSLLLRSRIPREQVSTAYFWPEISISISERLLKINSLKNNLTAFFILEFKRGYFAFSY